MLLLIILVLVLIKAVVVYRGIHILSLGELKRRARAREAGAHAIYKLAANYRAFDLLTCVFITASSIWIIIIAARSSWWAATLAILAIAILMFGLPKPAAGGLVWKYMAWASPYIFKATDFLVPFLSILAGLLPDQALAVHTGLYEKEDLLEIINRQNHQVDNRIPKQDLRIATGALTFGDKKVSDAMVPRRSARFVSESETIGPMLMDELHGTDFNIFPVIKASSKPANPEVIGMLYLDDLIDNPDKPKVKDIMHAGKDFIDEDKTLREALDEFIRAKKHLLVVTNNFQEVVGVLTLDGVVEQIIGKKLPEEVTA